MVTFFAAILAFVWYIWYIIPEMVGLFVNYNITLPPFTQAALNFATWMDNNYIWVFALMIGMVVGSILWAKTTKGKLYIHRYMIRMPYLGPLLHKLNLEIFCRVFSVLYNGSGENNEVLKIAAEATGNTYIEKQVKSITIPMMMASGVDLVPAMEAAEVFLPMTIARFRSGVESGSVRDSADEMADFYEKETTLKLEAAVETIKTTMALVISVLVALLTVISAETAFIQPSAGDIMFQKR
jgi:type IV pilus assembly protein PilC